MKAVCKKVEDQYSTVRVLYKGIAFREERHDYPGGSPILQARPDLRVTGYISRAGRRGRLDIGVKIYFLAWFQFKQLAMCSADDIGYPLKVHDERGSN